MKHFSLTCFFLSGLCFLACDRTDDDYQYGSSGPAQKYLVKSLSNYFLVPKGEHGAEEFNFDDVDENEDVQFSQLIWVAQEYERTYVSLESKRGQWLPVTAAEQLDPLLEHYVVGIEITSDKDCYLEDSTYLAGEDLSLEFLYARGFGQDFNTAEDWLKEHAARSNKYPLEIYMRFTGVLVEVADQNFTITLRFDDGAELSTTTPNIQVI